jgi:hypothetical protein
MRCFRMFLVLVLFVVTIVSCSGGGDDPGSPVWSAAQPIETSNYGDSLQPELVFDLEGNAFAIWFESNGTYRSIKTNRYTAGDGWGTAEAIDNGAGEAHDVSVGPPQIAVDGEGNALAVWALNNGMHINILANKYTVDEGWGEAHLIETDDSGYLDEGYTVWPQIAMGKDGKAVVVWGLSDGLRHNIWSNHYTPGSGWNTAELIETDDTGDAYYPDIAMDGNGNAVAVWTQRFNSGYGTYPYLCANQYISGTGWGTAQKIGDGFYVPQVVFDSTNEAIVIWDDSVFIRSIRFSWDTGWEDGLSMDSVISEMDPDWLLTIPQIAIDSNDNAIAVWDSYGISANEYTIDSGWGNSQTIGIDAGHSPRIAIAPSNHALTIWTQEGEEVYSIGYNTYAPTSGWGSSRSLYTGQAGNAMHPQIAIDSQGHGMAVWEQWDGSRSSIWSSQFDL